MSVLRKDPEPRTGGRRAVVIGGGQFGAALARALTAAGREVLVLSPTPRAHAGLWRRYALGEGRAAST